MLSLILALSMMLPDLVVFTDGRFVKVTGFEIQKKHYVLNLQNGGTIRVPENRVEQITPDEVTDEKPEPVLLNGLKFIRPGIPPDLPYWEMVMEAGEANDLNPFLIAAVIQAESNGNPVAVSHKGAMGLMQLMPSTCSRFKVKNPFIEQQNIRGGSAFLAYLMKKFDGDLNRVLAAYNAGEHTVERYDGPPPFKETINYIRRVLELMESFTSPQLQKDS